MYKNSHLVAEDICTKVSRQEKQHTCIHIIYVVLMIQNVRKRQKKALAFKVGEINSIQNNKKINAIPSWENI